MCCLCAPQIKTADGVEIDFAPLSLPTDMEMTVAALGPGDLACGLEATRFRPFGYKEVFFSPKPTGDLDPPARVKWRIPDRYKSLEQIKFVTTPSKDLCEWTLKKDVSLETRVDEATGQEEYYAWLDVAHFSVYALVQVMPLVDKDVPHTVSYTEDAAAVAVSPGIQLEVKEDNQWHITYPNLRIRSMNITIVEGYEAGKDRMLLPSMPGFDSEWMPELGILRISAIPGFPFTENTEEDYGENAVELVDVSEVLGDVLATATLDDFNDALRRVQFETSVLGVADRVMELSVNELLSADVVARISWTQVTNSPDPPAIIPSPDRGFFVEKADYTPLDPAVRVRTPLPPAAPSLSPPWPQRIFHPSTCHSLCAYPGSKPRCQADRTAALAQVEHEDNANIVSAQIYLEPVAPNDIVIYSPQPGAAGLGLTVSMDPATRRWSISGTATAEVYSLVLQSFMLKNNGPRVDYQGSTDRTIRFQVEDEHGRLVRPPPPQPRPPMLQVPLAVTLRFTVWRQGPVVEANQAGSRYP